MPSPLTPRGGILLTQKNMVSFFSKSLVKPPLGVWGLLLVSLSLFAQVEKTVQIDILGRPTWQQIIPLGNDGIVLFTKSDVTKAKAIRFDTDLNRLWETELFLDVEKQPTAFTIDKEFLTFMFSENQGMYYQLFKIAIKDGKFEDKGFELREFFQDQDYVFLGNRVLMAGQNEKGAAFYNYKFDEGFGDFIDADIKGKTQVQLFQLSPDKSHIESLWAVKELGYSDAKKKKGEFIKDAYVLYAVYDTLGQKISSTKIESKSGNFPMTGKLLQLDKQQIITGTYQSNNGTKGIYFAEIEGGRVLFNEFHSYKEMLNGEPRISDEDIKKIADNFVFLPADPIVSNGQITVGGTFIRAEYQTVSERNPNYNPQMTDQFGRYNRWGNMNNNVPATNSRQVFRGFNYLNGFVATFDLNGKLIQQKRIDMNQISPQVTENLAVTPNNSYSYCTKGNVAVGYLNIGGSPIQYKLSDDKVDSKNQNFIPTYHEVQYWHDKFFIAEGSRYKYEPIKEEIIEEKDSKKKKKANRNPPQANVRKIIYLSKISG
jgi:hypothetical protein